MASVNRSFGSLSIRGPRILAQRFASTSNSTPASSSSQSTAESTPVSSSSSSSTTDQAADASSSTPAPSNVTKTPPPTSRRSAGVTPFGLTNDFKSPAPTVPRSQQLLPKVPMPMPPWHTGPPDIYHVNYPRPVFPTPKKGDLSPDFAPLGGNRQDKRMKVLCAVSGLTPAELRDLRRCTVELRRVVNMTTKGKIPSMRAYVVVGDPVKGLVGIGHGKGTLAGPAIEQAFHEAVLSMDVVNRYEDRTVWGQGKELEAKFGSTQVFLRARPPGHGLQVPQSVHRILSAAGIRDASASLKGSTHPINVMKAVISLLHGGANPPGFGTGRGGHGKRDNKGHSMRSKEDIERQRGRFGVDIGLRV